MKFFAIILLLILISCDELVTTQKGIKEIVFDGDITSLAADGESYVGVTIFFDRRLSNNEIVKITTTKGHLIELPSSNLSDGVKTLQISPSSEEYKFLLVSSAIPDDDVVLGVGLNNLFEDKKIAFKRVCPDELLFDISDSKISLSAAERSTITFTLFNMGGAVSDETRIDLILNNDTLASVEPRVFSSGGSANATVVPMGSEGILEITASINQEGCSVLSATKQVFIIE